MNDASKTRQTILEVSHKLFAQKGFNGVSVREIAKESQVNLAAINYHFSNKENLYVETIRSSLAKTNMEIQNIYESLENSNFEEMVVATFDYLLEHAEDMRTTFNLLISSSNQFHAAISHEIDGFKGPPGGECFYRCLVKDMPDASEEDLLWVGRTMFTQVLHKAMLLCNKSICQSASNMGIGVDSSKLEILRLIKALKSEISR
ncbi:MAG: TetR/AcrR family transcriptional regulator [Halobacteriovoraceae bacterium]|jgi:AcrR family transcriptional regulator|nr:TetR/AcrR family transcriptional regulator [Halobacteriovoraceae bacterium]